MQKIISLGWDVAGYKSNKNAFALATLLDTEVELRICTEQLVKLGDGFYKFPHELFACGDRNIISIDAPFGFPSSLLDFVNDKSEIGTYYEKDSENIYAFRKTELEVMKTFGKNPLSPIFDKLGRNTFRVIRQLRKWKQECKELRVLPWDDETGGKLTAIEVYPGLLAGKTGLYNHFAYLYKNTLDSVKGSSTSKHGTLFSSFEKLYAHKTPKKEVPCNDEIDAAICALMGLEFAKDKANLSEITPSSRCEGIIYMPSFQNSINQP